MPTSSNKSSIDFNALGDKHKKYECLPETRLMPGAPVVARLDGKAFHTLTKNAVKPFDERIIEAMEAAAKYMFQEFCPHVVYVQSDEITLAWKNLEMFDNRVQKLCSTIASKAAVVFDRTLAKTDYELGDIVPGFDCRVFQYPSLELSAENILWREMDASKNSVSMAAHHYFGNKILEGVGTGQRIKMLEESGFHWNQLPPKYKRGSIFKKVGVMKMLTPEELSRIPEAHRPIDPVLRKEIQRMEWSRLLKVKNRAEALFYDVEPIYYE